MREPLLFDSISRHCTAILLSAFYLRSAAGILFSYRTPDIHAMTDESSDGTNGNSGESEQSANSKSKQEALGGKSEKGYSDDGGDGSEGGYGFIRPSAEGDGGSEADGDSE